MIKNKVIPLILMAFVCSCGKKSSNSDSKINTATNYDHIKTNFVAPKELACNYKNERLELKTHPLAQNIMNGIQTTQFDIIFPRRLSEQIVVFLKDHSANEKIDSQAFWQIIPAKMKKELNQYLVDQYATTQDKEFNFKRRLTAYAFTIFTEIENYQQAINIKANDGEFFKEFTVAFSYDLREKVDFSYCKDSQLNKASIDKNLLRPSDIKTNIICEDFYQDNIISLQVRKDKHLYLRFDTKVLNETIKIPTSQLRVINRSRIQDFSYKDAKQKLKIKVLKNRIANGYYDPLSRSYILDSIKHLDFEYERFDKEEIILKRLDCRSIKPFNL